METSISSHYRFFTLVGEVKQPSREEVVDLLESREFQFDRCEELGDDETVRGCPLPTLPSFSQCFVQARPYSEFVWVFWHNPGLCVWPTAIGTNVENEMVGEVAHIIAGQFGLLAKEHWYDRRRDA